MYYVAYWIILVLGGIALEIEIGSIKMFRWGNIQVTRLMALLKIIVNSDLTIS